MTISWAAAEGISIMATPLRSTVAVTTASGVANLAPFRYAAAIDAEVGIIRNVLIPDICTLTFGGHFATGLAGINLVGNPHFIGRRWRRERVKDGGLKFQIIWILITEAFGDIHEVRRTLSAHPELGIDPGQEVSVTDRSFKMPIGVLIGHRAGQRPT